MVNNIHSKKQLISKIPRGIICVFMDETLIKRSNKKFDLEIVVFSVVVVKLKVLKNSIKIALFLVHQNVEKQNKNL